MLISCERTLRNKYIINENKKDSITRIATITIILTITCLIKYRTIVIVSSSYN